MPAKPPAFSPTKLNAFIDCPLKYKYLYVDKIGRFYGTARPENTFGGTMHRVLQEFHRPGADRMSADELIALYRHSWVSAGFADKAQEWEYRETGERILREYHRTSESSPSRTILVEKTVKLDMEGFTLSGRIDRMDEWPDGLLEIIDYKSMRESVTEAEVRGDLAMSVYQMIVRSLYPDRRVSSAIVGLAGGVKASAELDSSEIADVRGRVIEIVGEIVGSEEFPPRVGERCERCDFRRLCSRQPWFGGAA